MPSCEVCNASVRELRRGRCWGCYARWVDARPVGMGARCLTCPEKRRRLLKSVELFGGWMPMCFNCAGQVMHLDPLPTTIAELKEAVSRERRRTDRRFGKTDSRVFQYERRVGERRALRADDCANIDDDMIIEVSMQAALLGASASGSGVGGAGGSGGAVGVAGEDDYDIDFDDQTRIRDLSDLPS